MTTYNVVQPTVYAAQWKGDNVSEIVAELGVTIDTFFDSEDEDTGRIIVNQHIFVSPQEWIVLDEGGGITIWSNENFVRVFSEGS